MKRILLPTDFSSNARRALLYLIDLIKDQKEVFEITLLHTYNLNTLDDVLISIEDVVEKDINESMEYELSYARSLVKNNSISFKSILKKGSLDKVVEQILKKYSFNLIVMGTKGAHNKSTNIIGTNTSKIVLNSTIPVLCVPDKNRDSQQKSTNVTVLLDDEDFECFNHDWFLNLLEKKKLANVEYLHFYNKEKPHLVKLAPSLQNRALSLLQTESITDGIQKFLNSAHQDLLVMTPKKESLWDDLISPSVTKIMAQIAQVPILALKKEGPGAYH